MQMMELAVALQPQSSSEICRVTDRDQEPWWWKDLMLDVEGGRLGCLPALKHLCQCPQEWEVLFENASKMHSLLRGTVGEQENGVILGFDHK